MFIKPLPINIPNGLPSACTSLSSTELHTGVTLLAQNFWFPGDFILMWRSAFGGVLHVDLVETVLRMFIKPLLTNIPNGLPSAACTSLSSTDLHIGMWPLW